VKDLGVVVSKDTQVTSKSYSKANYKLGLSAEQLCINIHLFCLTYALVTSSLLFICLES